MTDETPDVPDYVANPSPDGIHNEPAKSDQWENLTQDQIGSLRKRLVESIIQVVVQAVTGFFLPGGPTGDAARQLADWAVGIADGVAQAAGDLSELLSAAGQLTVNALGTAIAGAVNAFSDILTGLGLGQIADWITDLLGTRTAAADAYENASEALAHLSDMLTGAVQSTFVGLGSALKGAVDNFTALFAGFSVPDVGGWLASLLGIQTDAGNALSDAGEALAHLGEMLTGAAQSTFGAIGGAIKGAVDNFTALFSGFGVPNVGGWLSSLLGIQTDAGNALDDAGEALSNFGTLISNTVTGSIGGLATMLNTARDKAAEAFGNFGTLFSGFSVPNVGSWLSSLLGIQTDAGNALDDAGEALAHLSDLLTGAVQSTFTAVGAGIKGALDNFGTLFTGFSVPNVGGWLSSLLGIQTDAGNALDDAATADAKASTANTKLRFTTAANMVTDPSLENTALWSGAEGVMDTAQKVSGTQSRRIQGAWATLWCLNNGEGAGGADAVFWSTKVTPGEIYYCEAAVKRKAGNTNNGSVTVGFYFLAADGSGTTAQAATVSQSTLSTSDFTIIKHQTAVPVGYTRVNMYVQLSGPPGTPVDANDQFWVDELLCREVTQGAKANASLADLLAGAVQSTFGAVGGAIKGALDNFGTLFTGFSVPNVGGWLSSLLGIQTDAGNALDDAAAADGKAVNAQQGLARKNTAATNLCSDPGFETSPHDRANYGGYSTVAGTFRSGTQSAYVVASASGYENVRLNWEDNASYAGFDRRGLLSAQPGDIFYAEAYVKADAANSGDASGGATITVLFGLYDKAGTPITYLNTADSWVPTNNALKADFVKLSAKISMDYSNVAWIGAWVQVNPSVNAGDKFYVDDCLVREITEGAKANASLAELLAGAVQSTFGAVGAGIKGALDNFGSLFAGFGVPNVGGWLSSLLGIQTDAGNALDDASEANSNATTARDQVSTKGAAGSNLHPDPDMSKAGRWVQQGWGCTIGINSADGIYRSKPSSLKLVVNDASGYNYCPMLRDSYGYQKMMLAKAGTKFTIEGYIRAGTATTTPRQVFWQVNADAGPDGTNVDAPGGGYVTPTKVGWTKFSFQSEVAATADRVQFYWGVQTGAVNDVYYLDDVTISEVTAPQNILDTLWNGFTGNVSAFFRPLTDLLGVTSAVTTTANDAYDDAGIANAGVATLTTFNTTARKAGDNMVLDGGFDVATYFDASGGAVRDTGAPGSRTAAKLVIKSSGETNYVFNHTPNTGTGLFDNPWKVSTGQKFQATMEVRCASNVGNGDPAAFRIYRILLDSRGVNGPNWQEVYHESTAFALPQDWHAVTMTWQVPDGYDGMVLYAPLDKAMNATGDVWWIDNVVVKEVTHTQNVLDTLWNGFTANVTGAVKSIAELFGVTTSVTTTANDAYDNAGAAQADATQGLAAITANVTSGSNLATDPMIRQPALWRTDFAYCTVQAIYEQLRVTATTTGQYPIISMLRSAQGGDAGPISVKAGQKFKFGASCYLEANPGTGHPDLFLHAYTWQEGVSGFYDIYAGFITATYTWTPIDSVIEVPANHNRLAVRMETRNTAVGGVDVWWWDNLYIEEITAPQNILDTLWKGFTANVSGAFKSITDLLGVTNSITTTANDAHSNADTANAGVTKNTSIAASLASKGSNLATDPDMSNPYLWLANNGAQGIPAIASDSDGSGGSNKYYASGTTALRMTCAGNGQYTYASALRGSDGDTKDVVGKPGQKFSFEVKVKAHASNAATQNCYIDVVAYNALTGVEVYVTGSVQILPTSASFQTLSIPLAEMPALCNRIRFRMLALATTSSVNSVAGDRYYWDDPIILEITNAKAAQDSANTANAGLATNLTSIATNLGVSVTAGVGTQADADKGLADAAKAISDNAKAVQALKAQADQNNSSGKLVVIDFSDYADQTGIPSADWNVITIGSGGQTLSIIGGKVQTATISSTNDLATSATYKKTATNTGYQMAGIATSTIPNTWFAGRGRVRIKVRSNLAGTVYTFVELYSDGFRMGWSNSGTDTFWTLVSPPAFGIKANTAYYFQAGVPVPGGTDLPYSFTLWEGTTAIYTHNAAATPSPFTNDLVTNTYQYAGFGGKSEFVNPYVLLTPVITAWMVGDNIKPTYKGAVARAVRNSTSTVSHAGVAAPGAKLSATFFNGTTGIYNSADLSFNPTTGRMTLSATADPSREGNYYVDVRVPRPNLGNDYFYFVLFINGSAAAYLQGDGGGTTSGINKPWTFGSGHAYLKPGDYVEIGYVCTAALNLFGEAAGFGCYFEMGNL